LLHALQLLTDRIVVGAIGQLSIGRHRPGFGLSRPYLQARPGIDTSNNRGTYEQQDKAKLVHRHTPGLSGRSERTLRLGNE